METGHLKTRYERTEVFKRTLATCQSNLTKYFLSTFHPAPTWDTLKTRLTGLRVATGASFLTCRICEEGEMGHFFEKTKQIVLCANHIPDQDFNSTVTHELIHAYDDARIKINYSVPEHVACSEIRAVNLSGECKEEQKGWFGPKHDYTNCVVTRARANVKASPHFQLTKEEAEQAVTQVWDMCFNDLDPISPQKFTKSPR